MIEEDEGQEERDLVEHATVVADPGQAIIRVDKFLNDRLPKFSRNRIQSGLKSGISEVKAGAPKVFNINIDSLIREQNFETVKDVSSMKNIIRDEVSKILFGVVNDVQTS